MITKIKRYALFCTFFVTCQTSPAYSAKEIVALAPYALQTICKHAPLILYANWCIPKKRLSIYKDYPYRFGTAAMAGYLAYQQQPWAQKLAAVCTGYDLLETSYKCLKNSMVVAKPDEVNTADANATDKTTTQARTIKVLTGTIYASVASLFLWYHFWYDR